MLAFNILNAFLDPCPHIVDSGVHSIDRTFLLQLVSVVVLESPWLRSGALLQVLVPRRAVLRQTLCVSPLFFLLIHRVVHFLVEGIGWQVLARMSRPFEVVGDTSVPFVSRSRSSGLVQRLRLEVLRFYRFEALGLLIVIGRSVASFLVANGAFVSDFFGAG